MNSIHPEVAFVVGFGGGGVFFFHFSEFLFMLEISDSVRQSNFSAV